MRVCVCALFKSNTPTITIVKTAVSSNRHTNNNKSKQTTKMCIWTDIRTFRNNCTHSVFDWHDKRTSRTWEGKEVHSWRTQTKEIFSVQLFYTAEPKENKKKLIVIFQHKSQLFVANTFLRWMFRSNVWFYCFLEFSIPSRLHWNLKKNPHISIRITSNKT